MPDELIVRVAARGDGVTESGRHAPLAAPGDVLAEDGTLTPGPHHQIPPCRHFPRCGGCQLQHLDDASYAQFIIDRIANALAQQGLTADIRPPHLSPPRTRRRAGLQAERRGRDVILGFSEAGSNALVDVRQCEILLPELFALLAPLRTLLTGLLAPRRRAGVALTMADRGVDLALSGIEADSLAAAEALTAFAQAHNLARLSIDDGYGAQVRWEPRPATITLGGVAVPLPIDAFLQATADGEGSLVAAVREATAGAATTADLFAGLGTFALSLPGKVYAAEASRDATLALKGTGRVLVEHRDLYRRPLTAAEASRFAAIALDPPRAGAETQARELAASTAPVIAYVSCNPNSFARDARIMTEGGYRLDWIQPVGQFRWSTHVELAARFGRN
ncbi:class I SAM-dependent RNA methyltransferase [Sphingomonas gilva]|uniref:Class I SAM-dependent RNA methyltransferase n=1 Tax=Sphingomonas gilva TaxID=2305907 RepID=A0A396S1I8_9SPHN|nr:class I SAM-dependent RNA methyltransferase [Sphingomonas gilva]RHW17245.1 class I SAM-dependent RNA methyltransferase [Sphingomonas gilva]